MGHSVLCVWEMRVCVQRLLVVFLVSVQCGGVTEDFEADCTITDNINKIVRRLRLSSSKPVAESLETKLFESVTDERGKKNISELNLPEYFEEGKPTDNSEDKTEVTVSKNDTNDKKTENLDGKCPTNYENLDAKIKSNEVLSHSNYSSALKNNFQKCEISKIQEKELDPVAVKDSELMRNHSKPSTLLLPSCSYVDLTVVQESCGPGYKAMMEKLQPDLLHTIFFDSNSGHVIYAVHQEQRWQCCSTRRNLTEDVQCKMGTRC